MKNKIYKISKTDAEWKKELSGDEFRILREKGTELPFTGIFNDHNENTSKWKWKSFIYF